MRNLSESGDMIDNRSLEKLKWYVSETILKGLETDDSYLREETKENNLP